MNRLSSVRDIWSFESLFLSQTPQGIPAVMFTCAASQHASVSRATPLVQKPHFTPSMGLFIPFCMSEKNRAVFMSLPAQFQAAKWLLVTVVLIAYAAKAFARYRRLQAFPT
jgi:hypothetical protein